MVARKIIRGVLLLTAEVEANKLQENKIAGENNEVEGRQAANFKTWNSAATDARKT